MRKRVVSIVLILMLSLTWLIPISAKAAIYNEETVFDYADLLTDDEEDDLRKYAEKFKKYDISLIYLTTMDAEGKSSTTYSDDFYDNNNFRSDGVLLMIDMDNREIYINTVGKCIELLPNQTIYNTVDDCYIYASDGEYNLCLSKMGKSIGTKLENHYNPLLGAVRFSPVTLFITIAITAIILIILVVQHNRANQTVSANQYIGSSFKVNNRNAVYMGCRREVIRDYYASSDSGGGGRHTGGSVHRSSGGVRHGGGGRKF